MHRNPPLQTKKSRLQIYRYGYTTQSYRIDKIIINIFWPRLDRHDCNY